MRVDLGRTYEDTATGWTGVATSRTESLGGNVQVKLERLDSGGAAVENWFTEARLVPSEEPPASTGFAPPP